jgi:hypothetical protein
VKALRGAPSDSRTHIADEVPVDRYGFWQQVGGYFDGDGNVGLEVVKYVLRFKLRFSDTWRLQIEAIKGHLDSQGIIITALAHEPHSNKKDACRIEVGAIESVLRMAKAMLPYCVKKAEDLRIVIDYLQGRITGNQAIARFNYEVMVGRRSGYIREQNLPYSRSEGLRLSQPENARRARAAHAIKVSCEIQDRIRKDLLELKFGHVRLSKKYGCSASVRRILGAR